MLEKTLELLKEKGITDKIRRRVEFADLMYSTLVGEADVDEKVKKQAVTLTILEEIAKNEELTRTLITECTEFIANSIINARKITLEDFWNSDELLAIHCETKKEAQTLCEAFAKMGETWRSGDKYTDNDMWNDYKSETLYCNNNGYCFKGSGYASRINKVYEFKNIKIEEENK